MRLYITSHLVITDIGITFQLIVTNSKGVQSSRSNVTITVKPFANDSSFNGELYTWWNMMAQATLDYNIMIS